MQGMECPKCQAEIGKDSKFCSECGSQVRAADEAPVSITKTLQTPSKGVRIGGTFAGRYRIVDELGRGGMGVVYKAEDLRLERHVALKFLPLELTQDEEAKDRFVLEARAAAAISHPNICTIHEIDEFDGQTFIAMEFVEGQSLRDRVKAEPIAVDETLDIAIQAAGGLEEAHKKGIIHRDIKSANIMVTPVGQAKIMDFGLAKVSGGALITREGVTMGTVAYMSPEQARGEKVDRRTDIWSLGIVLYEMLSGQLPFWGDKEASVLYSIEHKEHKPIRAFNPHVPSKFEAIINRCLQKKPEARYKSAGDIVSDLRKFQDSLRAEEAGFFNLRTVLRRIRQPRIAIPLALTLAMITTTAVWYFHRQSKIRWATQELLPRMAVLIEEATIRIPELRHIQAYELGQEAEKYIPDNPELAELMSKCSATMKVETTPPGADIYIRPYDEPEDDWMYVGVSNLDSLSLPYKYYQFKLEKDGYETVFAAHNPYYTLPTGAKVIWNLEREIFKLGEIPENMQRIPQQGDLPEYFIDKHEVTNKKYKEFIISGGYQKVEFWLNPFIKEGKQMVWEEAMQEFVDSTGHPGPSTWRAGDYPEGEDNYPVRGISWYEAAAYAEFAGKSLPTNRHWAFATGRLLIPYSINGFGALLTLKSNFGGKGPMPVGNTQAVSFYGIYDLPGNVREWCWNEMPSGRCIRGGAWQDDGLLWTNPSQLPPFDRSSINGFRCAVYPEKAEIPEAVFEKITPFVARDFSKETPVSDEVFESYKALYEYDKSDLDQVLEYQDNSHPDWVVEKVSFAAAYGDERVPAYLFLPKNFSPPFQTVIYFPGSGAVVVENSSDNMGERRQYKDNLAFLVKNGRAVLFPIYKGTYERGEPSIYGPLHTGGDTYAARDYWIQFIKDFRRSIDYLETHPETDKDKLAYYGFSWGGMLGAVIPAVEERIKVSVLNMAGLRSNKFRPEIDPFNYITHVKIPTLMLNGKYDMLAFPQKTSAQPFYSLLGTPKEDKIHKVYDSDHFIPTNDLIREVSQFLDKYLGPVNSTGQD
jgi:dienelactone hydrolase